MSGIVDPPKIIVQTLEINRYTYDLINLIPHTSAQYRIFCYNGDVEIKYITGLLEGEQYKEWTDDDWLDRFIRNIVETLPDVEEPEPVQPEQESLIQDTPVQETPIKDTPVQETPVQDTPVQETPVQDTPVQEIPIQEIPVEKETPIIEPTETLVEQGIPVEQETPVQETPI